MSEIILETQRLLLREWDRPRAKLFKQHCNNDLVLKELGNKKTPQEHEKLMNWLIDDQQNWFGITYWALEAKASSDAMPGEFLGFCGLVRADEPDNTVLGCLEIGWRLRADAQGKKFAKEAAVACLRYAFEELRALRVVSRTTPSNEPSWRLMQALGMYPDPRLDYLTSDGEHMIVHVINHVDWKAKRPSSSDKFLQIHQSGKAGILKAYNF